MTALDPTEHDEQLPTISSRYLIAVAVFIAAVALLLLLGIRNQPAAAVIEGASMAPAFLGAHWKVTCSECQFCWPREESITYASSGVICPNCAVRVKSPHQIAMPPDRVGIDHKRYQSQTPQRWDVVAIRRSGEWSVKRIVGLPGEIVSLKGGNVLIDGRPCSFTADIWRSQAVLLHTDRHRNPHARENTQRWQPIDGHSAWTATETGYRLTSGADGPLAELHYQHERFFWGRINRPQASSVLDDDHFNSGPPRNPNTVGDLAIRLKIAPQRCDELRLALRDGVTWHEARWSPSDYAWQLLQDNVVIATASAESLTSCEIEFITRDGRLLLTLNRRLLLSAELPVALPLVKPSQAAITLPCARIAARGELEIRDVEMLRDIVYLSPQQTTIPWQAPRQLNSDEYFVLGDNSPVSVDSRAGMEFTVRRHEIMGLVTK